MARQREVPDDILRFINENSGPSTRDESPYGSYRLPPAESSSPPSHWEMMKENVLSNLARIPKSLAPKSKQDIAMMPLQGFALGMGVPGGYATPRISKQEALDEIMRKKSFWRPAEPIFDNSGTGRIVGYKPRSMRGGYSEHKIDFVPDNPSAPGLEKKLVEVFDRMGKKALDAVNSLTMTEEKSNPRVLNNLRAWEHLYPSARFHYGPKKLEYSPIGFFRDPESVFGISAQIAHEVGHAITGRIRDEIETMTPRPSVGQMQRKFDLEDLADDLYLSPRTWRQDTNLPYKNRPTEAFAQSYANMVAKPLTDLDEYASLGYPQTLAKGIPITGPAAQQQAYRKLLELAGFWKH